MPFADWQYRQQSEKNTGCKSKTIRMDNERKFQAGTMECINSLKDIPAGQATYVGRYQSLKVPMKY